MTTQTFAFYDPTHGGIMRYERTTEPEPQPFRNLPYITTMDESVSNMRVNLLTLTLEPMPEMPIPLDEIDPVTYVMADGVDEATFTNVPAGTTVEFSTVDGFYRYVIDDGELSLTLDMPQAVRIMFKHPAYLTTWRVIHAY